jgi:choline dehydrogenase-like flavoprotein
VANASPEASRDWDVVVIGTGIGGATAGWALASRGLRVLFLEKGARVAAGAERAELDTPEERLAHGWWPHQMSQQRPDGRCDRFFAPLGCALGGSSVHYAAALERMAASDFEPLDLPQGRACAWPVSFQEFEPFYDAAESLYGIGPAASRTSAPPLSEWDLALCDTMQRNGLRPERLKVAMRYDEQCTECIGRICPRECKADARTSCLEPALREAGCGILPQCEVQSLQVERRSVRAVRARYRNETIDIRARVYILAAGAFQTPQILLRSRTPEWPQGLANRSDQVGRNLMFHGLHIYALWAPRRLNRQARQKKSLSVRDFYLHQGRRLGYVQSMGLDAGRGDIAAYLKQRLRRRGLRNELLLRMVVKLPAYVGARLLGDAGVFAAMTEDDPNPENRVILDPAEPDGARFAYTITADLRERAAALGALFARHIRPWRLARLSSDLEMNYGHPCGTCRFGDDPAASVLNRECRTHDLDNLYVLDASFMPRSGAVNPSLTIAANALRVAPVIASQLARPPGALRTAGTPN